MDNFMWKLNKEDHIIMAIILVVIAWIALLIWNNITNRIKVWDQIRCWDLIKTQYDGEVIYRHRWYIMLSGTKNVIQYWNRYDCEWYFNEYYNCVRDFVYTGQWALWLEKDWCFRPSKYKDLIKRQKDFNDN